VVTLSAPASTNQSVTFATLDGSATAGSDYLSVSNTVTFIAGETQKVVSVTVLGDTTEESDETFHVALSAPSAGVVLGDPDAVGTILDDDLPPNQLPVAVVTATPTSGTGPLSVSFTGSGSYDPDPDGSIASHAWTFGDGASSSAQDPSHTYSAPGTYTATLTVTDDRGGIDAASIEIVVNQDQASIMHVDDIAMELVDRERRGNSALATITIVDASGQPVQGATVTGRWTGLTKGTSTATTDANGDAVMTSRSTKK